MTGNSGHATIWADDRMTNLLVDLFNAGKTVAQIQEEISKQFGAKITKSSVCGRVSRLRKSGDRITRTPVSQIIKHVTQEDRARAQRESRARYDAKRREAAAAKPRRALVVAPKSAPLPPGPQEPLDMRLEDLTPHQCRYPHGNGPFTFCGCETARGRVYCAAHTSRCYQPLYRPDPAAAPRGVRFGEGYGVGPVPGAFIGRGHGRE